MKARRILVWIALICLLATMLPSTVFAASNGWVQHADGTWSYYQNGAPVCSQNLLINGKYYGFDWRGIMYENRTFEFYDRAHSIHTYCRAKADGSLCINEWYLDDGVWYYYGANGAGYHGFRTVGGVEYCFNRGRMCSDEIVPQAEIGLNHIYYAIGKDGRQITAFGKHTVGGNGVYVTENGTLACNKWVAIDGKWYYFRPKMAANQVFVKDQVLYVADNDGVCIRRNTSGFYHDGNGYIYAEGGKVVTGWKWVDGAWYYLNPYDNYMVYNTVHTIDGVQYVFDQDGKLFKGGWIRLGEHYNWAEHYEYRYAYADKNGIALTGVQTINAKQYVFDKNGYMEESTLQEVDRVWYAIDGNGEATVLTGSGWKHGGGNWYYFENGEPVRRDVVESKGRLFLLGSDGAMKANGVYGAYFDTYRYVLLGSDGAAKIGWQQHGGHWYYADANGWLRNGLQVIDGKKYYFDSHVMMLGSFVRDGVLYTTNSSGAITEEKPLPDGWTYADGEVFYYRGGKPYTGWVGEYYINGGRLQYDTVIYDDEVRYVAGDDGRYIKNGWHMVKYNISGGHIEGYYVYAKGNGILCENEWKLINGSWYYFEGVEMVANRILQKDGKKYRFGEDGRYLGKVVPKTFSTDGWHLEGGRWYYAHCGVAVTGPQYIDGTKYVFGDDGVMLSGGFVQHEDSWYYTTGSGAIPNYTGWKLISGEWCYFDKNNQPVLGWFQDGGDVYYSQQMEKNGKVCIGLRTEPLPTSKLLHRFDKNGNYLGAAGVENGWYQTGGDWYYFEDGKPADGYRIINQKRYHFNYGKMITEDIRYYDTGAYYYGSDGAQRTATGWYETPEGWICVKKDGALCDGLCQIGGKLYYMLGGLLVE